MAQVTTTIRLGDCFPDGSFRIHIDNDVFEARFYADGSTKGLYHIQPLSLDGITGKVIPLPGAPKPIEQTLTYEVTTYPLTL